MATGGDNIRIINSRAGTQNIIGGEVHFIHNFNLAERNPVLRVFYIKHDCLIEEACVAHRTLWDAVENIGTSHNSEQ